MKVYQPVNLYVTILYHRCNSEFQCDSWRGLLDTTQYDKVCQRLMTGRWIPQVTPPIKLIMTEIWPNVALNDNKLTQTIKCLSFSCLRIRLKEICYYL